MATTTDGHRERMIPGKAYAGDDIGGAGAAGNQRWPAVDHGIEYLARGVVLGISRADQLAPQGSPELVYLRIRKHIQPPCEW